MSANNPMYEEDGCRLLLFSTERAICAAAGLAVPHRGPRSAMPVRAPKRRDHAAAVSAQPVLGRRLLRQSARFAVIAFVRPWRY
jgi:hypothetical protein